MFNIKFAVLLWTHVNSVSALCTWRFQYQYPICLNADFIIKFTWTGCPCVIYPSLLNTWSILTCAMQELTLSIEKQTLEANQKRKALENEVTENIMAQVWWKVWSCWQHSGNFSLKVRKRQTLLLLQVHIHKLKLMLHLFVWVCACVEHRWLWRRRLRWCSRPMGRGRSWSASGRTPSSRWESKTRICSSALWYSSTLGHRSKTWVW